MFFDKHFYSFSRKIAKKFTINQRKYRVINSDNMLQMRNTNDI